MAATKEKPWLEYGGETIDELIGLSRQFRVDSILCAIEQALGHKRRLSEHERVFTSLMDYDREVHNGGFALFFRNSSRRHAPVLVENLLRIGAKRTAALAERAIAARRDADRLHELDQRLMRSARSSAEVERCLWAFVKAHRAEFALPPRKGPRRKPSSHADFIVSCSAFPAVRRIREALGVEPPEQPEPLARAMERARYLARQYRIRATQTDLEGAACWLLLEQNVKAGNWPQCAKLAPRAVELCGEVSTGGAVMGWLIALIEAGRAGEADRRALDHLIRMERSTSHPREEIAFHLRLWQGFLEVTDVPLPRAMRRCERILKSMPEDDDPGRLIHRTNPTRTNSAA